MRGEKTSVRDQERLRNETDITDGKDFFSTELIDLPRSHDESTSDAKYISRLQRYFSTGVDEYAARRSVHSGCSSDWYQSSLKLVVQDSAH